MRRSKKPILIAGPTASGKSALALALAKEIGGVIINADSMQVYRELRILTARPSVADEAEIPHCLYGEVDASQSYSVARWLIDVRTVLNAMKETDRTPIIVGGTGMFFTSLTQGLADIPPISPDIRRAIRDRLTHEGVAALHARLAEIDPDMAQKLRATDSQRVARALEVIESTGRSLSAWQAMTGVPDLPLSEAVPIVLDVERSFLYKRIDTRFEAMLAAGAIAEAELFSQLHLSPDLPVQKTLGLHPLIEHLNGRLALPEAVKLSQTHSRQYAKRQITWFGNKMIAWNRINAQFLERALEEIFSIMAQRG